MFFYIRLFSRPQQSSNCIIKTVKFPTKAVAWGAVSIHGTSRLFVVKGTMNVVKYIEMLNLRLKPQIKEWFGDFI